MLLRCGLGITLGGTADASVSSAPLESPLREPAELLRLAPLLVGRARRGVVGSSRYARSLRESVSLAAADVTARPVLISGEPGLEKDNLAALIHFGSAARHQLMLQLDGALLRPDGSDLFGTVADASERPLLELLAGGALLIDKLDQVPADLRPLLLHLPPQPPRCSRK